MIRTLTRLVPVNSRGVLTAFAGLAALGIALRAGAAVLLIPLVSALFSEDPTGAWPWFGWLSGATLTGWVVDAAAASLGTRLGFALLRDAQRGVAARLARVRLDWFTEERTTVARRAIAATGPDLVGLFTYLLIPLGNGVLFPVFLGVALLPVSWPLGVAALLGVPILLGAFFGSARISRGADRAASARNEELTEHVLEFARTQEALRAARRVAPERSAVGAALGRQHGAARRLLMLQVPGQLLFGLATQLTLLGLAGTAVLLAVRGELSPPEAVAAIVVFARYLESVEALATLSAAIESVSGVLGTIRQVLDAPVTRESGLNLPRDGQPPTLSLRGVSFGYGAAADTDTDAALNNVTLEFPSGTTTAIVGPSGSGKSTLLAMIAGLREPTQGQVRVAGTPLEDLSAAERRALVTIVFQHPTLFAGSIRENVLTGAPEAGEQRFDSVARLARVDLITAHSPGGYDTPVGEGGVLLSGGERQRVSIARALIKSAPLLLIDEATSALDTENEAAVVAALAADPTPRTRVIVAHRLRSIETADRVVFLEQGRVVEEGTVAELLAADGRFAAFWRLREESVVWGLGRNRGAGAG